MFCPVLVTLNVVEHPYNKLVSVITYDTTAINSPSVTTIFSSALVDLTQNKSEKKFWRKKKIFFNPKDYPMLEKLNSFHFYYLMWCILFTSPYVSCYLEIMLFIFNKFWNN